MKVTEKKMKPASVWECIRIIDQARSADATRYFMAEAYYDLSEGERHLVATDGKILAAFSITQDLADSIGLAGVTESTYIALDPKRMSVRPIKVEAQFPQWRKVLPKLEDTDTIPGLDAYSADINLAIPLWLASIGIAINPAFLSLAPLGGAWRASSVTTVRRAISIEYRVLANCIFHLVLMPIQSGNDNSADNNARRDAYAKGAIGKDFV